MQNTTNYNLKKPELTDYVNINDLNDNADIIDAKLKENADEIMAHKKDDAMHNIPLKIIKSNKDSEGIFTTVKYRRKSDDTLSKQSVLSGGTTPQYTTRTVTYYKADGITVLKTDVFTLSYDSDGILISEV